MTAAFGVVQTVVNLSKIKISKAIHNMFFADDDLRVTVVNLSKIKISKAIHNYCCFKGLHTSTVVNLSKIKISKAIHNTSETLNVFTELLSICQR